MRILFQVSQPIGKLREVFFFFGITNNNNNKLTMINFLGTGKVKILGQPIRYGYLTKLKARTMAEDTIARVE